MNKILGFIAFLLGMCSLSALAQDGQLSEAKSTGGADNIIKPARDFFMIQATYDNWANTPDDVHIGGLGRGFAAYLCYDFPIKKSNFSFAVGLGVHVNNIYFKDQRAVMNTGADAIQFVPVDTVDGTNFYKKSKLTTTYLEAPFELRFFSNKENRNRGFKMALGMRVGVLLGAHTKDKHSAPDMPDVIVEKVNTKRYIETWRFAPTARIGWGNFSIVGSYSLSPLFNNGQGPEVYPYSIGICISGL